MSASAAAGGAVPKVAKVGTVACLLGLVALVGAGCAGHSADSAANPAANPAALSGPGFASPQKAADALASAARSGSSERIVKVLGPDAGELVHSGDPVQDTNRMKRFVARYDERHEIVPTIVADDTPPAATNPSENELASQSLCIGDSRWPFPIPLLKDGDKWHFDTSGGRSEILNRRIGRNELTTIQTMQALVDAERDYVSRRVRQPGALPEYAGKFISDARTHDGLYWSAVSGQAPSPLDDLVASATSEGYEIREGQPYHGYYYRFLKSQGSHASGGAYDYEVKGKLIGGFAVIARPATYGNSGVMSFIVNQDGKIYQADLGPDTETAADKIISFDPGPPWHAVE